MKVHRWLKSFRYAYEGLVYALKTQKNMKFHFFAAFCALVLALLLHLSKIEILFILLAVTLIFVTELINTAVEKAVDLAMPETHPIAKIAKDVAAASVLVAAFFAIAVGVIVFYEPLLKTGFERWQIRSEQLEIGPVWVLTCLVLLITIVLHMRFTGKGKAWRPSLTSALSFSLATMIALQTGDALPSLIAFSLSLIIAILLYDKTKRSLTSIAGGAAVGIVVAVSFYLLW